MSKSVLLQAAFLLMALGVFASPASDYNTGNEAYAKKNYQSAINSYLKAYRAGVSHPNLNYNLANAYYKTGDLGKAIVFAERAHKLDRYDRDIHYNLNFFRKQIKISQGKKQRLSFFERIVRGISDLDPFWLSTLHTICLAILIALLFLKTFRGHTLLSAHRFNKWIIIDFALYLALSVVWLNDTTRETREKFAIATALSTSFRAGPGTEQTEILKLPAGIKLKIISKNEDWYQVRLIGYADHTNLDGLYGWVSVDKIELI